MPKQIKAAPSVRTRRAYFDYQQGDQQQGEFRQGQLHVRTAFPTTGGFDEQVTLFCLHSRNRTSRMFDGFLPLMAKDRSVYAPDLPGSGETDAPPAPGTAADCSATADLANGLRLRQIDVLGFQEGSEAAVALALARPELVRKLVLIGIPSTKGLGGVTQNCLVMHISDALADITRRAAALLPHARVIDGAEYAEDLFEVAPGILVDQLSGFLNRSPPAADRATSMAASRKAGTRRG